MAAGGTRKQMILEIAPRELRFAGNGNVHADTHLELHNPTDKRIAFKVKTTAPRRYCVRPNSGVVEPSSTAKVGIVYQPVDQPQQSEITRHKFLIQALALDDNDEIKDELWRTTAQRNPDVIMESKMRVVFPDFVEGAGGGEHGGDTAYGQQHLPGTSSPYTGKESPDSGDMQRLLEENRRLKDENNTVKDEMKILKADRNELMKHAGKQGSLIGGATAGGGGGGIYGARRSVTINEAMLSLQVQMVLLIIFVLGILFGKIFI